MASNSDAYHCPVCDSQHIEPCISLKEVPVYCNVLYPTQDEARQAARGDIDLAVCRDCGHLFNTAFDPGLIDYSLEYENSLHYSGRFQEYATSLAHDLASHYKLQGKTVVELACGKGDFLAELCKQGDCAGVGFDPSFTPERFSAAPDDNLTFIQDYYSERYSNVQADLICCRHALEHIESPREFLKTVRLAIGERPDSAVFFEVPNSMYTLRDMGIWDIIYEHCGYFSQSSLEEVFIRSGFSVSRLDEVFDGQFLSIDAKPAMPMNANNREHNITASVAEYARTFERSYREILHDWEERLSMFEREGSRLVVWGAGSKGVTFLNVLGVRNEVDYIVDLNPHKQGKYVAGTGHEVVAPEFLKRYLPDTVIVMNPIYRDEISTMLDEMGLQASICVV